MASGNSGNMSSSNSFDPCRTWLGISALELDDPKKLLALDAVDDPIRILQAAEARLVRLQSVEPGPYEVARRALVARVEEARDKLLTAAAAGGLRATPAPPGGLAMPPSPTAAADGSPALEQPFLPASDPFSYSHASGPTHLPTAAYPAPSGQPGYEARFPEAGHAEVTAATGSYPSHHQPGPIPGSPIQPYEDGLRGGAAVYRRSSSSGPLLLLVAACFTVLVALGLFALQGPPPKTVASKPTVPRPAARKPSKSVEPSRHPLASRDRPFALVEDPPRQPSQETVMRDEPDEMEPVAPEPALPKPPTPAEQPMKKPEPPPADEPDPLAKIDDAVKRCLEALSQRDYDTAEEAMKSVEGIAPDNREANRIAGWLQLTTYTKGFYDYQNQAIDAMKPGDEYDVKTKKIAVVEVNDQALTVKVAGQLKTWQRDDLPGAVARAVVETWFNDDPANQLYLGAYLFTKPEPDLEQAEACWNQAKIGGADASLLIPLLTDPVVVDTLEP